MKTHSLYIVAFLLLSSGFSLVHGQKMEKDMHDATLLNVSKEYTLNEDGSTEFRCRKEIKILTYFAFHRLYGETFIVYNPEYQTVKINECYTLMSNGKKVPAPPNAFNEVLPRFAANAPAYNQLKELVITHTGLEIGSTVVLDYTLGTKKGFYPALMGIEKLAEANPADRYELKVNVPVGTALNFRLYHWKGEPTISQVGGKRIFHWHFENIPAYLPEAMQPEELRFIPTIVFTTARDMQQSVMSLTGQAAFQYSYTDAMKQWAENTVKEIQDPIKVMLTLQEKVIKEFNLYNIPLSFLGFRVRSPEETWAAAGGTELEKAILLTSLFSALNIEAKPVAVFPAYYDIGMGNLMGMNHFYVLVSQQKQNPVLLSVTELNEQNLMLGNTGLTYLPLDPKSEVKPLINRQLKNLVSLQGKWELEKDNTLDGKINIFREGMVNPWLSLVRNPKRASAGISGGLSAGNMQDSRIKDLNENFSKVEAEVIKSTACNIEGSYYFFSWPCSDKGLSSWHMGELTETRYNPFEVPFPLSESYSYEITLPKKWKLVNPLTRLQLGNQAGQINMECRQEGRKVFWFSEILIYQSPVIQGNSDYYNDFRELLIRWNAAWKLGSIFQKD